MTTEPTRTGGDGSSSSGVAGDSPAGDNATGRASADGTTGAAAADGAAGGTTADGTTEGATTEETTKGTTADGAGRGTSGEGGVRSGTFESGPSNVGRGLTLFAGLLASVSLTPALPAVGVGVLATAILAYGLRTGSGRMLGAGVATLVVALLVGGLLGMPAERLVLAAAGSVLAWDVGDNALSVGEQLGRNARTARLEVVHAAASLAVAVVGAAVSYGVFRLVGGGHPILAVVLLLLGATILVVALR